METPPSLEKAPKDPKRTMMGNAFGETPKKEPMHAVSFSVEEMKKQMTPEERAEFEKFEKSHDEMLEREKQREATNSALIKERTKRTDQEAVNELRGTIATKTPGQPQGISRNVQLNMPAMTPERLEAMRKAEAERAAGEKQVPKKQGSISAWFKKYFG